MEKPKSFRLYVSSQKENTVAVVDLTSEGKFIAKTNLDLNVGSPTRAMTFVKDQKKLHVGLVKKNTVVVFFSNNLILILFDYFKIFNFLFLNRIEASRQDVYFLFIERVNNSVYKRF